MRPALRVVRAAAALGAAAWLVAPWAVPPASAADQTVTVGGDANRFSPATVTIDKGDTVTWQYGGGTEQHTVTSTTSNWDKNTQVGPPNGFLDLTTTYTFTKSGTYLYVCTTHESVGMRGKVIVLGATTSPKPSPSPSRTTSASPTVTQTSSPTTPGSASPSTSASPAPGSPTATPSGSPSLLPGQTFAPRPTSSQFLGEGGLRPQPPTGRAKGLPFLIALLLIGGVGSAELRALLAYAPE